MELEEELNKYDYKLPQKLIANKPLSPRDSARLLIYKPGKQTEYNTFKNIGRYLPKNSVLVFNQTKVWPARLPVKKLSGGKAELLYISHNNEEAKFLSNRPLKPSQKVFADKDAGFEVLKKTGQFYFLKPLFNINNLMEVLKKYGVTPLPPYIKNSPLSESQKRREYQSVFAKTGLSMAAPTASLHFTKNTIKSLKTHGTQVEFLRLDVGLGTFASLTEKNLQTGKLHEEFYYIDSKTASRLNKAKKQGRPIIAVGTTVARTLESASFSSHPGAGGDPLLKKLSGTTNLFIRPPYHFKFIDGLITNFHVPKSSLLMLVSAFIGRKNVLNLYKKANQKKFRFFSFGDGMLLIKKYE